MIPERQDRRNLKPHNPGAENGGIRDHRNLNDAITNLLEISAVEGYMIIPGSLLAECVSAATWHTCVIQNRTAYLKAQAREVIPK